MENNAKIAICYCLVDNYDEIVEFSNDDQANLLLAQVEHKLNYFANEVQGMFKKLEKDRYLIIMHEVSINQIKNNQYKIIKSIKEIEFKIPITLSVGVCYGEKTINKLNEGARQALDFALGRGGDQIVIKKDSGYELFGDAESDRSKNFKVKARVKSSVFSELIREHNNVIIMGHKHPDLDCIGSAIGAFRIVKTINPFSNCKIVIDDISTSIEKLLKKVMEHCEYQDDIFIKNHEALSFTKKDTLLIIVDVFRKEGTQCPELLRIAESIVVFDHHRKSIDFIENPVLVYHDPSASSTSELICDMIVYFKDHIPLLKVEADALLSGITVDTKGFTFKTSYKTFEAAAFLKKKGASSHNVHKLLQSDLELYKIKSSSVNNAFFYRDVVAMTTIVGNVDNPILVTAQTADELLNLTNIKASFVFFEINDKIYISARSLGQINVQVIMEILGGGGHRTIAAAQVENTSVDTLMTIVKSHIDTIIDK